MSSEERIKGCLAAGAIGDALGSHFENRHSVESVSFDFSWSFTDDTQFTLATCESILQAGKIDPAHLAAVFLRWYNGRRFSGMGASTLKAMKDLQMGAHWALAGREGEFAAGNGAAMRIAPLAFLQPDTELIRDVCRITHKNEEAYTAALAVVRCLQHAFDGGMNPVSNLTERMVEQLPDTAVRDTFSRLLEAGPRSIWEAAAITGHSGYAAASVPLAVFAAQCIAESSFAEIMEQLIRCGGDTDTICALAGQIIGTAVGYSALPAPWRNKLESMPVYETICNAAAGLVALTPDP